MSEEHYDFNDEDTGKRFKKLTLAQRKRFKDYREVLKQFDVSYDDLAFHLFELKEIVDDAVERKLYEVVVDPDEGLKLKPGIRTRLRKSLQAQKKGGKGIPARLVAKRLGLKW